MWGLWIFVAGEMVNKKLKISLVIPNYNSGACISRCIDSILSQRYENLELILADGGSTDESIDICRERQDVFAVFISERDRGIAHAINRAYSHATGDVFCWLAADDALADGALDFVAEAFSNNTDLGFITGGCVRHFEDGSELVTTPPQDLSCRIMYQNCIEQPSTFWRRDLFYKCGSLDEEFKLAFDWDLWCRFVKLGVEFDITNRVLSHYYFSSDNLTSSSGKDTMLEMYEVVRRYGPYKGVTAYLYRFLFHMFDLHGCYDRPMSCSRIRRAAYYLFMTIAYPVFGETIVHGYNWSFVSKQMRGLKWYR